jgi:hypothetical protein
LRSTVYLRVSGLEQRLVEACQDMLGANLAQVRLHLDAYQCLVAFAKRYGLFPADEAAQAETELARLRGELNKLLRR